MARTSSTENLLTTLASITVPLIQLIAVTSLALGEQIEAANVFPDASLLPLLNISAILLILGSIGTLTTLERHKGLLPENGWVKRIFTAIFPFVVIQEGNNQFLSRSISVSVLKPLLFFQLLSFFGLLAAFVGLLSPDLGPYYGLIVYSSYVFFLVASGLLMYIWLEKFLERRSYVKPEDYYGRLVDRLRENGKLAEKQVELKNSSNLSGGEHLFKVLIQGDTTYYVHTDYAVTFIQHMWSEKEAPQEIKNQFLFPSQQTPPTSSQQ